MRSTLEAPPAVQITCPAWCDNIHGGPFPEREERLYRRRIHSKFIGALEDEQGLTITATVEVFRSDSTDTGEAGPIRIKVEQAEDMSPAQAAELTGYILKGIEFAREAAAS